MAICGALSASGCACFAACGSAIQKNCKIFVTQAAIDAGLGEKVPYSAEGAELFLIGSYPY